MQSVLMALQFCSTEVRIVAETSTKANRALVEKQ